MTDIFTYLNYRELIKDYYEQRKKENPKFSYSVFGQMAGYRLVLQMRAVEHAVAVGVRDELGRVESPVTDTWDPTSRPANL